VWSDPGQKCDFGDRRFSAFCWWSGKGYFRIEELSLFVPVVVQLMVGVVWVEVLLVGLMQCSCRSGDAAGTCRRGILH